VISTQGGLDLTAFGSARPSCTLSPIGDNDCRKEEGHLLPSSWRAGSTPARPTRPDKFGKTCQVFTVDKVPDFVDAPRK
jgi:hypothetical protein